MLIELDGYDWAEVFGEGIGGNCTAIMPTRLIEGKLVSEPTFSREDVELIRGQCEGENDGADWIVWGRLKDGRWFIARGGCDYTGWDCQAGNSGDTYPTEEELIRYGMTQNERDRFEMLLPDQVKP